MVRPSFPWDRVWLSKGGTRLFPDESQQLPLKYLWWCSILGIQLGSRDLLPLQGSSGILMHNSCFRQYSHGFSWVFSKGKKPQGICRYCLWSQSEKRKEKPLMPYFPKRFYCLQIQAVESRRMRRKTRRKEGIQGIVSFLTKILFFFPSKLFKGIKDHHGKFFFHWLCANHPQNAADSAAQSGGLNPSLPQESIIWILFGCQ